MGKRTNTAVWMDKYNRWQIKVQKDGERKTFTSSKQGIKGKRECHAKADAWLDEGIDKGNERLSKLYQEWLEELKEIAGTSHWKQYDYFGRIYIIPQKGNKRIYNVNEQDLQDVILLANKTGNNGQGLAYKTLLDIRNCLVAFIKYCRKNKATTLFPESLKIPKDAPKREKRILQPDDLKKLFAHDTNYYRGKEIGEWYIYAFRFAVATGLRPGEVLGLRSIDIKDNQCSVCQSMNAYNEITDGKNANAKRTFILPKTAMDIIKKQKAMLTGARIISPYVFPDEEGQQSKQRSYYKHWLRYRKAWGITTTTLYEMRHTWFSINKTLPPELVKAMGGHGQDFDTFGWYGHSVEGEPELTASLIEQNLAKILK